VLKKKNTLASGHTVPRRKNRGESTLTRSGDDKEEGLEAREQEEKNKARKAERFRESGEEGWRE
jgi:hypothetical protein